MSDFDKDGAPITVNEKQVGILTFHFTTNYGGMLQAYALSQLIRNIGVNCNIIDYRPASAIRAYGKELFFNRNFLAGFKKALRFYAFLNKNMQPSKKKAYCFKSLPILCEDLDVVVVGSDEVWKIDSFRGYDPSFFLDFLSPEKKRMSFSASLGSTSTFAEKAPKISRELRKFSAISVRDDHSTQVLNKECGIQVEKFLDPTLLVNDWDEVCKGAKNESRHESYVLVYGKLNLDELSTVQDIAKQNDCFIISVGEYNPGVDTNHIAVGPGEWLSYFRSAKFVFTTFFHGVIFSLKFHEEVFVFRRDAKSYKIDQLKEDLALVVDRESDLGKHQYSGRFRHYSFSDKTEELIARGKTLADQFLIDTIGC